MPTVTISVSKAQKQDLQLQADQNGTSVSAMCKGIIMNSNSSPGPDPGAENDKNKKGDFIMNQSEKCPGCIEQGFSLQLKERDLTEAREETNYWQEEAKRLQQETARLASLAKQLESKTNADTHRDIRSMLQCPTCGPKAAAELPGALDKRQALPIAKKHLPHLFEPVKIKGGD